MEERKLPSPRPKRMVSRMLDSEGPYRLLYCSSKGCTEVVLLLLEKRADVNSLDRWGRTPLSDARSFDPVGLDSQTPCYEIDFKGVDMETAALIGEVISFPVSQDNTILLIFKLQTMPGGISRNLFGKVTGYRSSCQNNSSSIASNPRELALWQRLRHPNIVQFLGVLKHSVHLIFLTEYLQNGSLYDILKRKGRLDPPTAVAYALDIARGMNYLCEHKPHAIIHRDLTPRNVLLDESGHLKVTDFGLSKITQEKDSYGYKMTGGTGSYRYCRELYGKSVDVFSFALIIHEMFQGVPSNSAETAEQVADKRAYEIQGFHSPHIYTLNKSRRGFSWTAFLICHFSMLLRECWHKNPDCRPTFEEIILQLEAFQESLKHNRVKGSGCVFVIL
ncbi:hypothetical protein SLE2022_180220 [Rubroshorea leprosula]